MELSTVDNNQDPELDFRDVSRYSGRNLMVSRIMGSDLSRLTRPKLLFHTQYIAEANSFIRIQLLESVSLYPKVIPVSGFHCIYCQERINSQETLSRKGPEYLTSRLDLNLG